MKLEAADPVESGRIDAELLQVAAARLAAGLDGPRRGCRAAECVEEIADDEKQSTVHVTSVARHRARPFFLRCNTQMVARHRFTKDCMAVMRCAQRGSSGFSARHTELTNQFGSTTFIVNQNGDRMMSAFTVRLPDETVAKLDQLAEKVDRSRSYVAAQAIEDYVAREEWQLAEIEAGLDEADRGEFASEKDLAGVIAKYVKPASER